MLGRQEARGERRQSLSAAWLGWVPRISPDAAAIPFPSTNRSARCGVSRRREQRGRPRRLGAAGSARDRRCVYHCHTAAVKSRFTHRGRASFIKGIGSVFIR